MCTSRYCTNTLYASLQFTDLYTWVSYLIQDQPELMKCTKCFCWGRKKKKQLKMIFSVVILIWVLALDKNSRPPKTRRTVRTNLLAVIEQIRVTSITAAHLSALIPPSHFTPFHLPLHKLCWQQGLAARNDPLSRSQLVKALPDWRFDRCYHGSLTTEECDKPHLLACDWQSGISPLSQTKHRPPPLSKPCRMSQWRGSNKVYTCILDQLLGRFSQRSNPDMTKDWNTWVAFAETNLQMVKWVTMPPHSSRSSRLILS